MNAHVSTNVDELIFNGLDGATGQYLLADVEEELASIAQTEETDPTHLRDLKARVQASEPTFGVVGSVDDTNDLAQTGWGIVFAEGADPAIREALTELRVFRQEQAARQDGRFYQEYSGQRGYHAGESKEEFLRNRGAATSGPAEPNRMPYYLLLVGAPETIPYAFQYQLDVQYAVGRIHFDSLTEYAAYARSVVTAERANPRPARATFFGVANPDDRATRLSDELLVGPLAAAATTWQARPRDGQLPWQVESIRGAAATKSQLTQLLAGPHGPALLFTAGHGLGFATGDPRQEPLQGSLVCSDWPGPSAWTNREAIPAAYYVAAEDIGEDARLLGLVAFHFACYGLGTPRMDDFPQIVNERVSANGTLGSTLSRTIADRSFVARLPQRLLGHPRGGALAVIGHVERALGSSFQSSGDTGKQSSSVATFEGSLSRLMRGYRVGAAVEQFNERYAELCATLSDEIRMIQQFGKHADPLELARLWTGSTDARGYAIFGDPAVRLAVDHQHGGSPQPSEIDPVCVVSPPQAESAEMPTPAPASVSPAPPSTAAGRSVRLEIDPDTGRIIVTAQLPAHAVTPGGDELVSFGLGSMLEDMRTSLGSSLRSAADQIGNAVSQLVADVTSLEVATYVNDEGGSVSYDARQHAFVGPVRQCAMTCIRADGDVLNLVPRKDGQVDRELWAAHCEQVERAQAQRAEMIKALASAVSALLGPLKLIG